MRSFLSCLSVLFILSACGSEIGPQGTAGSAGEPCTIEDNGGSATITCPGSDPVTVFSGLDGQNGNDGVNGTKGENGTNGTSGANGTNGTNGHSTLAVANDEPAGDNCQFGGTKISMGLDNGDGGGTADDGLLQSGEIDSVYYVCHGDGGDAKLAVGQLCVSTDECVDTATCVSLSEDNTNSGKCRANCSADDATCDTGFNCTELNSAASATVTPLAQADDDDTTDSVFACGPAPEANSSWTLTIVSAVIVADPSEDTWGSDVCDAGDDDADARVLVNGSGMDECDDDDCEDTLTPVWNYNRTLTYTNLETVTVKVIEDDASVGCGGDDDLFEGDFNFQPPWADMTFNKTHTISTGEITELTVRLTSQ